MLLFATLFASMSALAPPTAELIRGLWIRSEFEMVFRMQLEEGGATMVLLSTARFADPNINVGSAFLGIGNPFSGDLFLPHSESEHFMVPTLFIGPNSAMAMANPLFTLAPGGLLSMSDEVDRECKNGAFSYQSILPNSGRWAVQGSLRFNQASVDGPVEMRILTNEVLTLDLEGWLGFWTELWASSSLTQRDIAKTAHGQFIVPDCADADLVTFPKISILIGEGHRTDILPEEYVKLVTSADGMRSGCFLNIGTTTGFVGLGDQFLAKTLVQFDNAEKRLGFATPLEP